MGRLYNRRATVLEPGTRLGPYEIPDPGRCRRHGRGVPGARHPSRPSGGDQDRCRRTSPSRRSSASGSTARRAPSPASTIRTSALSTTSGKRPAAMARRSPTSSWNCSRAKRWRHGSRSGPLPVDYALALRRADRPRPSTRAHRAGIAHGDLKPGNVMVTKAGVKLLDFGLALPPLRCSAADGRMPTPGRRLAGVPGQVLGSLEYLAPEQLEGRPADARSDVFACGAVIFEMLTGRPAFAGETQAAVIAAVMRQQPPLPSAAAAGRAPGSGPVGGGVSRQGSGGALAAAPAISRRELAWLAESPQQMRHSSPAPADLWLAAAAAAVLLAAITGDRLVHRGRSERRARGALLGAAAAGSAVSRGANDWRRRPGGAVTGRAAAWRSPPSTRAGTRRCGCAPSTR